MEASVNEFVHEAQRTFGRIDILVNNAGVMTRPAPMVELEVRKWDYTIAVNLRGPFLVTQAVLPFMLKQKSGSIINVSSMIGRGAYANFVAYATSKWGLEGFSQTLAAEVEFEPDPGEFRGTGLRRYQAYRLSRQQARIRY